MRSLVIAGVALRGDGYPNAVNTCRLLATLPEVRMGDQADWLPDEFRLWQLSRGPLLGRLRMLLRLTGSGAWQALRLCLLAHRQSAVAYLPYPAPFTLWWLSFIPERLRPRCLADAYVSLWDAMFRDRGMGRPSGLMSRAVHQFEERALRAASLVLVDTTANATQLQADYKLPAERVQSLPLAINAGPLQRLTASTPKPGRIRVLFIGTLVPLHGIEVVLGAVSRLARSREIDFRLIGDGQLAGIVEAFMRNGAPAGFTWVREWQPAEQIAQEIGEADICLGVFGGVGKAARVLPFKLYLALAAGRPVITQQAYGLPEGCPPLPVLACAPTADDLAAAIARLAEDPALRAELGQSSRLYYQRYLSPQALAARWRDLLNAKAG